MSWTSLRGPRQRLRVVGDHRVTVGRPHQLLGPLRRPGDHRLRLVDVGAEPPLLVVAEQRPLRRVRGLDGDRDLVAGRAERAVELGGGQLAQLGGQRRLGRRRRRGRVGRAERLLQPSERLAQLELPKHVTQPRAVGLLRRELRDVEAIERDLTLGGREVLGDPGVVGVLGQVLLALGAGDLVDRVEHVLQRAEPVEQVGGGLVADPGDAGDVVRGVALEPEEIGHQLRRDPVAVDHALAVVHLGVGDPRLVVMIETCSSTNW